jgi:hypothetical protein
LLCKQFLTALNTHAVMWKPCLPHPATLRQLPTHRCGIWNVVYQIIKKMSTAFENSYFCRVSRCSVQAAEQSAEVLRNVASRPRSGLAPDTLAARTAPLRDGKVVVRAEAGVRRALPDGLE